jgi:hypothetical protein
MERKNAISTWSEVDLGRPAAKCLIARHKNPPGALPFSTRSSRILGVCLNSAQIPTKGGLELNCCGTFNGLARCPKSSVAYYNHFEDACPNSYAYSYVEPSGPAP